MIEESDYIYCEKKYEWSIEGLSNFANDNKMPLMIEDLYRTGEKEYPFLNIYCFESDKSIIEKLLYFQKPIWIGTDIISIPNEIEYNKKKLIEYIQCQK